METIEANLDEIRSLLLGIQDCLTELNKMDIPKYYQFLYMGDYADDALECVDTLYRLLVPIRKKEGKENENH